jgi:N-acetylglucosamine kinase-like BadF-type ATPase
LAYVLGVDAGGSKTLAAVAGMDGRIRGAAIAGPGSHERVGMARAVGEIRAAVTGALRAAGCAAAEIAVACYGLAGADWPEDFVNLDRAIAEGVGVGRQRLIKHDAIIALRAGTRESHGAVVIFGTGSAAAGRNRAGQEVVLGNLGYPFGDHCGAQAMATEGLRAVFRADDGREPPTLLTDLILAELALSDVAALKQAIHLQQIPYEQINGLVHQVFQAAAAGDRAARQIVAANAEELGRQGCAVVRNLGLQNDTFHMVMAGGLWHAAPAELHEDFRRAVLAVAPGAQFVRPDFEPVVGALLLALEAAGVKVEPAVDEALGATRHLLPAAHKGRPQ